MKFGPLIYFYIQIFGTECGEIHHGDLGPVLEFIFGYLSGPESGGNTRMFFMSLLFPSRGRCDGDVMLWYFHL